MNLSVASHLDGFHLLGCLYTMRRSHLIDQHKVMKVIQPVEHDWSTRRWPMLLQDGTNVLQKPWMWSGEAQLGSRQEYIWELLLWTIRSSTNLLEAHVINFVLQHFV